MNETLSLVAALCRTFEGFRAKPYLCPASVATIGYGSTRYADGSAVKLTDPPMTQEQAEELLIHTIKVSYLPGVLQASPGLAAHPRKLAAIVDFAYNCGVSRYRASTLRRCVDGEHWDAAKDQLLKWTRGGGRVLPGLVLRRKAEGKLL
ncbi:MAG: lysozyme [Ilumatobacteraceae bacterium]|nr:lysozyme [Ilumatobacteraceae bacterium]